MDTLERVIESVAQNDPYVDAFGLAATRGKVRESFERQAARSGKSLEEFLLGVAMPLLWEGDQA